MVRFDLRGGVNKYFIFITTIMFMILTQNISPEKLLANYLPSSPSNLKIKTHSEKSAYPNRDYDDEIL